MKSKRPPTDVAASIRARLLNLARAHGDEFQVVLSNFATERFLYRLSVSPYASRFVLKGAMLLRLWSADRYRATWDIDLLGLRVASPQAIEAALHKVCAISSDDGLIFDPDSIVREDIRFDGKYAGVRVKLTWRLAGARIPMQIDVAFGESIVPPPQTESYPTLLDHPSPQILAYPREVVVAEKLEAILTLGPTNSRMKDFYDLRLLASNFDFEAPRLLAALRATFKSRGTPLPESEPQEFTRDYLMDPERSALWRSFWRRSRPVDPPESVEAMADALQRFLWPVCRALAGVAELPGWWSAGGPWR